MSILSTGRPAPWTSAGGRPSRAEWGRPVAGFQAIFVSTVLGKVYELIERGIVIKPYPRGVASHPAIDAVLDMRENDNLRAEQVERIEVGVTTYTYDKLSCANPGNALEGKFSMAYPVARALLDGRLDLDNFQDTDVRNPILQDLIARSEMYEDEEIER